MKSSILFHFQSERIKDVFSFNQDKLIIHCDQTIYIHDWKIKNTSQSIFKTFSNTVINSYLNFIIGICEDYENSNQQMYLFDNNFIPKKVASMANFENIRDPFFLNDFLFFTEGLKDPQQGVMQVTPIKGDRNKQIDNVLAEYKIDPDSSSIILAYVGKDHATAKTVTANLNGFFFKNAGIQRICCCGLNSDRRDRDNLAESLGIIRCLL